MNGVLLSSYPIFTLVTSSKRHQSSMHYLVRRFFFASDKLGAGSHAQHSIFRHGIVICGCEVVRYGMVTS